MILFSTRATQHLVARICAQHPDILLGASTITQLADGELCVRVDQEVCGQTVWVIAATSSPAENLLELFFLLQALTRSGARIKLLLTYLAYARQVTAAPRESLGAQLVSEFLRSFQLEHIEIVHPHSILLHDFLAFTAWYPVEFFCEQASGYDAIAAPDAGAHVLAREIAARCHKELIVVTKRRDEHQYVMAASVEGTVAGRRVLLVDDMVATGHTLIEVGNALMERGAVCVAAAATHGVLSPGARERIESSVLESVVVTNTINQIARGKISVFDISGMLKNIMCGIIK